MNQHLESAFRYFEQNRLKIATAESVTAGMAASMLADRPGSGEWLECAFVTYSEEAKVNCLGVRRETVERYNLTSEPVAREMAEGALRLSRANAAVSTTGVAGPNPGEGDVEVGTVCFAWSFEVEGGFKTFAETRNFVGDRNEIRCAASEYAIGRICHYHGEPANDALPLRNRR